MCTCPGCMTQLRVSFKTNDDPSKSNGNNQVAEEVELEDWDLGDAKSESEENSIWDDFITSTADFDPYYIWLGIPRNEQPPNYYRLLGIRALEDNVDVINNAAEQRIRHVRTFQSGDNGHLSQELVNKLSQAKLCLLDRVQKRKYDEGLFFSMLAPEDLVPSPVDVDPFSNNQSYYQYLGLREFESNTKLIEFALGRKKAEIASMQVLDESVKALPHQRHDEMLNQARICLLDRSKKQSYDEELIGKIRKLRSR